MPKHILVAEDSPNDFMLLQVAFEAAKLPHSLHHVTDGLEVVSYLKSESPFANRQLWPFPDLLILDIHMPKVDAFDILSFLGNQSGVKLPVILLSGSMPPIDIQKAMRMGAAECFNKPEELVDLITLVQTIHHRWLKEPKENQS
jgi:CheY-like chemotaxis protein